MKITTNHSMLAALCLNVQSFDGQSFASASTWAAPVQGISMSAPATQLGGITVTSVTADAAKGANRKRTTGYLAFEDPL